MLVNRRKLIQVIAIGSAAFVAQACSKKADPNANVTGELGAEADAAATTPAADKPLALVSETDATATALGYKHNAAEIPAAEKTEKNGIAGANQNCKNCAFFAAIDGVEGGKCSLIMAGYVKPNGWCKSWSLKQG